MNHYKWIVFKIQDLSTSEFVHSVIGCNGEDYAGVDLYELSTSPIQYFVKSDDIEAIAKARDVMEAAINSIYEISAETKELHTAVDVDGYEGEEYVVKSAPGYLNNFVYYNMMARAIKHEELIQKAKNQKQARPASTVFKPEIKKLHKNRFQIIEEFTSKQIEEIELWNEDF